MNYKHGREKIHSQDYYLSDALLAALDEVAATEGQTRSRIVGRFVSFARLSIGGDTNGWEKSKKKEYKKQKKIQTKKKQHSVFTQGKKAQTEQLPSLFD